MLSTEIQTINAHGAIATETRYQPEWEDLVVTAIDYPGFDYITRTASPDAPTYRFIVLLVDIYSGLHKAVDAVVDKPDYFHLAGVLQAVYGTRWAVENWYPAVEEF